MPFSYAQYAGNGSATTFSVPFPYLLKAHVKLFYGYNLTSGAFTSELVDGVGFTWTSGTQVQTTVAPAVGQTLTIVRQTPSNALVVQWQDGSNLVADDLQDSSLQTLYAVQEQDDVVSLSAAESATAATSSAAAVATANAASTTANGIAGTANTALSNSSAAVTTANAASATANGIAGTANTALSNSSAAVATANAASATATAAQTTANGIAGTANTALSNSSAAVTTANAADATASGIAGTANTALSNSTTAQSTANSATTAAAAAQSTANAALPKAGGTMTGNLVVPSLNGGPLAGFRNRIINGNFDIAQRGTSFASAGGYTLDRWALSSAGTMVCTVSQSTDVPDNTFQSSHKVDVTTADTSIAAGDYATVIQIIEGYNVRDLIGTTFTLSFWVKSPKTGAHSVGFRNVGTGSPVTPNRSHIKEYTITTANTWEYKTLTVTGGLITAGTWDWTTGSGLNIVFALACGTTYQNTADAWQTGNFFATANQVNVMDNTANDFFLTGVQLEPGPVATPFERRPIGTELALCQRYYQELTRVGWRGDATNAEIYAAWYNHSTMRTTPSVVIADVSLFGFGAGIAVVGNGPSYLQAEATCNSTGANRYWLAIVKLSAEL